MKTDHLSTKAPTQVRFGVLAFVCTLSMVTYLDRVCFGTAAPHLVTALGLSGVADLRWAFTAFAFAYAAFEIPTGWLGDVFGPRNTLIRIVLWWSVFTAITGLVGMVLPGGLVLGVWALVVIRFLFGIGEAGAYPNITRALHNWFPFGERGTAQGAVWMSGRLMGGLTPLLWWLLVEGIVARDANGAPSKNDDGSLNFLLSPLLDWRQTFWLFGGLGILWCVLFALWFRNRPEEKESVNDAERELILAGRHGEEGGHGGVPWLHMLTRPNLWFLCLMYFCAAYGWYFNITYLPSFLEEQYHVEKTSLAGALYKGGPLWVGAVACLAGGWMSDAFIRRTGNRRWGRRLFGLIGHSLCALCYVLCVFMPSAFGFFVAISLAAFWNDMTMGAAWATCQDIGRRYAAIVAGTMNTVGNLGGACAGTVTGLVLQSTLASHMAAQGIDPATLSQAELAQQTAAGNLLGYQINLLSFAAVYGVAVVLWLFVDPTKPVVPDTATAEA